MAERARGGGLRAVRFKSTRVRAGIGACAVASLLGFTALAATAGIPTRHALLSQLERAATPQRATSGRGLHAVRRTPDGYSVDVALTPNRPSGPNRLSVLVAENSRPLSGARVRVTFSMPAMKMWNGYVATLTPLTAGRYTVTVPVLGMVGQWQLGLEVAPRSGRTFRVTVDDRMHR